MIILAILGYLMVLLLALLLLILIIPVNYKSRGQIGGISNIEAYVSWFFGGVEFQAGYNAEKGGDTQFKIFGKRKISKEKIEKKKEKDKEKEKSSRNIKDFLDKGLIDSGIQFLKGFFKHLKPKEFRAEGSIGFDDPYHTAVMNSIVYSLNIPNIRIDPVYDDEVLEGSYVIRGRLILGVVVLLLVRFLLTKPVRRIIINEIKNKKGEKIYVKQSR